MMRLGLIGLGRIGAFHAETLSALPAVDTLVVADTLPGRAAQIAGKLDAEIADSSDALLRSGIDGLVIAAATDAHPALLREAVEAGVPVFCEKPVAATAGEAAMVTRLVAGCADRVQIGYPRRFDAGFARARDALQAGQLGWLHTIRSTTLDPAPPPRAYAAVTGGIFRDCSVHDFDAVRWVTGREVVEVYATGSNRGEHWIADLGDVDTAATILTLDDGCLAVVSNTRYHARGYDVRLELHGSLDSIAAGLDDGLPLGSAEPGVTFPAGPRTGSSWTGSPLPSAPSSPRSLRSSAASGHLPAPWPTPSNPDGSPRPPRCRCVSTARSAWTRCASDGIAPPVPGHPSKHGANTGAHRSRPRSVKDKSQNYPERSGHRAHPPVTSQTGIEP